MGKLSIGHAFHSEKAIEALNNNLADIVLVVYQEEGDDGEYQNVEVYVSKTNYQLAINALTSTNFLVEEIANNAIFYFNGENVRDVVEMFGGHLDEVLELQESENGYRPDYLQEEEEED